MHPHPDVLIVGGGVIGLTSAWFLAKAGRRVTIVDKGELGSESSWAGAGIISPGNPEHAATAFDQLRALSARMFPGISNEMREATGIDNGYRPCGGIAVLGNEEAAMVADWRAERITHHRLTTAALRELEPALIPPAQPAYHLPGMAQVRNPWHVRALVAMCERHGVSLLPNAPLERFERQGSTISQVHLATGQRLTAECYLLAAGAWSDLLLHHLGVATGIHPVRGQMVLLKTPAPMIRRIVEVGKKYLVPREDGHVLIGSTEEPEAGFVKQNTPDAIIDLLDFAQTLVPALSDAERIKTWSGLRPGSIDGLPSLGRVSGFDNLYLAGGHFRTGINLSPATALVMSELLCDKPTTIQLDDFQVGRIYNHGR